MVAAPIQLSVVLVNYNGLQYIQDCIEALHLHLKNLSYEIIIFDNASQDNSVNYIKYTYPDVKLIESKENLGFGGGNNEATKHANGLYLLLLNIDTILLQPIDSLFSIFEKNNSIGLIGIKMLNENRHEIDAIGNFPNFENLFYMKRMFTPTKNLKHQKAFYEIDWITGAFMLTTKFFYNEVGGFDTDYFLYVEDVDLCKKYLDKGLKTIFVPSLSYVHFVGFNSSKNDYLIKGYRIYIQKHFKGFYKILAHLMLSINATVKGLKLKFGL